MTINQDKNKIEDFLDEPIEGTTDPAPFSGTYRSKSGLFSGSLKGNVNLPKTAQPPIIDPTPPPLPPPLPPEEYEDESHKLLAIMIQNQGIGIQNQNQIIENQLWDRIEYERSNPLINDSPVYDWEESVVPPGFMVIFTLTIPDGKTLFLDYFNISFEENSIYNFIADGISTPALTEVLMDFGDHYNNMFNPPRLCYSSVVVTALNDGNEDQTYSFFIRGFLRDSTKVNTQYLGQR